MLGIVLLAGCDDPEDQAGWLTEGQWSAVPGTVPRGFGLDVGPDRILVAAGSDGFHSYRFGDAAIERCAPPPGSGTAPAAYGARAVNFCGDFAYFGVAVWDTTDHPVYVSSVPEDGNSWSLTSVAGPTGNCLALVSDCEGGIASFSTFERAGRTPACGMPWQVISDFWYSFIELSGVEVGCETWLFGESAIFTPFVARVSLLDCPDCVPVSVFPGSVDQELEDMNADIMGVGRLDTPGAESVLLALEGGLPGIYVWRTGDEHLTRIRPAVSGARLTVSPEGSRAVAATDSLQIWSGTDAAPVTLAMPGAGAPTVLDVDWSTGTLALGVADPLDGQLHLYVRAFPELVSLDDAVR